MFNSPSLGNFTNSRNNSRKNLRNFKNFMNVATICYLFKTMVNFANMLLNRLRLCYTWTLVWT